MSEQTINRINEGVALALFVAPLAIWCYYSKDYDTAKVLTVLWFFPFLIFCYDLLMPVFDKMGICSGFVEKVKGSRYKISRLSLCLFLFTVSLIVILALMKYQVIVEKIKELVNDLDQWVNIIYILVLLFIAVLFGIMIVSVFCGFIYYIETPDTDIEHEYLFYGFIFNIKSPKDEVLSKPKTNHVLLSKESQQLMAMLQQYADLTNEGDIDKTPMFRAVTIIFRDYLDDFIKMQGRQATGDEIVSLCYLRNYIPSMNQIRVYPKESLELMLSSSEYVDSNFVENPYFNFRMINGICLTAVEKKIGMLKTKKIG